MQQTKTIDIVMPKIGESIMEATILKWLKKEGDTIKEGQSIVEIATDKVDSDIPSTHTGTIQQIIIKENTTIPIGTTIAKIKVTTQNNQQQNTPTTTNQPTLSPLVKKIIQQNNIPTQEIQKIPATGTNNKLTKQDIQNYLTNKPTKQQPTHNTQPNNNQPNNEIQNYTTPGDQIIPMNRIRKLIAQKMVQSKNTIPHVTSFAEANVTQLVNWMNTNKKTFLKKHNIKLTYTAIFIEAIVKTIKNIPILNSIVIQDKIIKKNNINIGFAVALKDHNLIVPVIKNTDQLSLQGIAIKIQELVTKAHNNNLKPNDISAGTYTFTNLGSFNNIMGTPIIMKPQVGIMGIGRIKKQPHIITTPNGDAITTAHKVYLSHSFDHRVIDGAIGGQFVNQLAQNLENFDTNKQI